MKVKIRLLLKMLDNSNRIKSKTMRGKFNQKKKGQKGGALGQAQESKKKNQIQSKNSKKN